MARTSELRCPECGVVLGRLPRRPAIGRVFEECPRCRTLVRRPTVQEWDLLQSREKLWWMIDRVVPPLVLGLVPAGACWATKREGDGRALLLLAVAGLVVGSVAALARVRGAVRRSRRRMADPMYRARLIELGRRPQGGTA
jgi:hypothetical protein